MTDDTSDAIRIQNVTHDFETVRAVDNLTLEVPTGTIFGFLGPNGAGKTTTIQILLGLIRPTAGSATVLGFDTRTAADEIRARTGALLEHTGLYEQMTAAENLEFYRRVDRMSKAGGASRTADLLSRFGLWDRRDDRVAGWSRGMKQRLALARALLAKPELLFLDEPTAGLDVMAATELRETLVEVVSECGATVFLTTHNMSEAERLCEHVAIIRQGRLLAVGSPGSVTLQMDACNLEEAFVVLQRAGSAC